MTSHVFATVLPRNVHVTPRIEANGYKWILVVVGCARDQPRFCHGPATNVRDQHVTIQVSALCPDDAY